MKSFVGFFLLIASALPFTGVNGDLGASISCVSVKTGEESQLYDGSHRQMSLEQANLRIIVKKPESPNLRVIGSEVVVCDKLPADVSLAVDNMSYITQRNPEGLSEDAYYELTVYYEWVLLKG